MSLKVGDIVRPAEFLRKYAPDAVLEVIDILENDLCRIRVLSGQLPAIWPNPHFWDSDNLVKLTPYELMVYKYCK